MVVGFKNNQIATLDLTKMIQHLPMKQLRIKDSDTGTKRTI